MHVALPVKARKATISAVITRVDGTKEDLGIICGGFSFKFVWWRAKQWFRKFKI